MKPKSLIVLAFAAVLAAAAPGAAEESARSITLTPAQGEYRMERRVEVLPDYSGRLGIDEVTAGPWRSRFRRNDGDNLSFGLSRTAYWLRFTLANRAPAGFVWLLEVAYPINDQVDLYYRDDTGAWRHKRSGDRYPFRQRDLAHHTIVFILDQKADTTRTYYLRVASNNSIVIPLTVWSAHALSRKSYHDQLYFGLIYGIMVIMALYNIILFISIGDRSYCYFAFLTTAAVFYFACIRGHAIEYLWPAAPSWADLAPIFFLVTMNLAMLLYIWRLLGLTVQGALNRFFFGLAHGCLVAMIAVFFIDRHTASIIVSVMSALSLTVAIMALTRALMRREALALYFFLSWTPFFAGALLSVLRAFSLITPYVINTVEIGFVTSIILFSLSIAYRYNAERREKINAQAALLEQMQLLESSEQRFNERLQADKIESLSVFAGGIAHDFNNLLTAILGNVSLARDPAMRPEGRTAVLDEAEKASLQARNLTGQLLAFSKGGEAVRQVTPLADLIRSSMEFALSGSGITCSCTIDDDLDDAEINEGQIKQVIHNLVLNAREAMPDGGTMSIEARNERLGTGAALPVPPGRYVRITVADHGCGIQKEHLPRIFDPYFTTKEKGSGLGLAICYAIVKRHGGSLLAQSSPGWGTVFTVYLPGTEHRAPDLESRQAPVSFEGRVALLMDDEEMVLNVGERMLRRMGLTVMRARSGEEALALYHQALTEGPPIDLVIMDLTIPGGMGGKEAAARMRELDTRPRLIVSSGYSTDPIMANFASYGFDGVVPKPYRYEDLAAVLGQVMNNQGGMNTGGDAKL